MELANTWTYWNGSDKLQIIESKRFSFTLFSFYSFLTSMDRDEFSLINETDFLTTS